MGVGEYLHGIQSCIQLGDWVRIETRVSAGGRRSGGRCIQLGDWVRIETLRRRMLSRLG